MCIGLGLVTAGALWLLAPTLAGLFSDQPEVVDVSVYYLTLVPWSYAGAGAVMLTNAAFNGIGRPLPAVSLSVSRALLIYVPVAYLGASIWDVPGVFMGALCANLIAGVWAVWWHRRVCRQLEIQGVRSLDSRVFESRDLTP